MSPNVAQLLFGALATLNLTMAFVAFSLITYLELTARDRLILPARAHRFRSPTTGPRVERSGLAFGAASKAAVPG
jgi:hypothetical protein